MKSLRIQNGDVVLGAGNRAAFVTGKDKLIQDLKLWLMEPLGIGWLTPNFGSTLSELIGEGTADELADDIADEIRRILGLYQQWQIQRISEARTGGTLGYFAKSEILDTVESVETVADGDSVRARITITTLGRDEPLSVDVAVSTEGIRVA